MKKSLSKLLAVLLVIVMAVSLCACGKSGGDSTSDMYGTYNLVAMDYDEGTVVLASEELFSGKNYVTLKSGREAEFCMEDEISKVEWTKNEGSKITIIASDGNMDATVDKGVLTLVADDSKLYFAKEGVDIDFLNAKSLDDLLGDVIGDVLGSDEDPAAAVLGKYELYAFDSDLGVKVLTEDFFDGDNYIDLKEDGQAEMAMDGDVYDVTWTLDGNRIVLSDSEGDMEGTIDDGILALTVDDVCMYYVNDTVDKSAIGAVTADEALAMSQGNGFSELQEKWNGWYYGCIDFSGCTGQYEEFNDETFDAVMAVDIGADGTGKFVIYDPFAVMVENDDKNSYAEATCHVDDSRIYVDEGTIFGEDMYLNDWVIVRNLDNPNKLNVGSVTTDSDTGEKLGYDFTFLPWGDRWENESYSRFIPYFDSYLNAIDAGVTSPFVDENGNPVSASGTTEGNGNNGHDNEKTGKNNSSGQKGTNELNVNDRDIVYVYYPDGFEYDDWYGKLKNEDTGVGILLDPMLGATNLAELKASYEEHNSDEDDYSLVETTIHGYKAIVMKYSDWLGSTMRVDIDFGGNHDGWYGISFAVSGDSLDDCDTDEIWAIIESMEIVK